jgi:hypothetical protein
MENTSVLKLNRPRSTYKAERTNYTTPKACISGFIPSFSDKIDPQGKHHMKHRIVVKVGSLAVTNELGGVNIEKIKAIVSDLHALKNDGYLPNLS